MVGLLVGLSCAFGPALIFKLYGVPYLVGPLCFLVSDSDGFFLCDWLMINHFMNSTFQTQIFVAWLDLVTYLHHHGHEQKLPWYRGKVLILLAILKMLSIAANILML